MNFASASMVPDATPFLSPPASPVLFENVHLHNLSIKSYANDKSAFRRLSYLTYLENSSQA